MDLRDFIPAVKYGASLQNSKLDSGKILIGDSSNLAQEVTPSGAFTISTTGVATLGQGEAFVVTGSASQVALNAGYTLLADTLVGSGKNVYVGGVFIRNNTTVIQSSVSAVISLQDSAGTSFLNVSTDVGGFLTVNTLYTEVSTGSVAAQAALYNGTGGTDGRGLQLKASTGTVASGTITFTVWGIIK
jgi:hypothetical protein